MRVPQRLASALLFAAISLLALGVSGLLDWISSLLFLFLEMIAERFRARKGRVVDLPQPRRAPRRGRTNAHGHRRAIAAALRPRGEHDRRPTRCKEPHGHEEIDEQPGTPPPAPRIRVLVPLSADRPGLLAFALDECRDRRAELLVLFLRPFAVMPMGPDPIPSLKEDNEATRLFARIREQASDAGVPVRTLYEVSRDMPASILENAQRHEAGVLIMEATRRNLFWRALMGDITQEVIMHLPDRVSLLLHA